QHQDGVQELKFRAFGTPLEKFIVCEEGPQTSSKLDPDRCNIGSMPSESELVAKSGAQSSGNGGDGNGSSNTWIFVAGGATLFIALVVVGIGCTKLGGAG